MIAFVVAVTTDQVELASDALWALGVVAVEERGSGDRIELWTSLGDDERLVAESVAAFPAAWQWRLEQVDESVADTWREHAVPTWIDQHLVVVPAWLPRPADTAAGVIAVSIEPGSTFGLGDHPTTVLSLQAVRDAVSRRPGCSVLDVGCGSGVLAIGAVMFGAGSAHGIDIAPAAVAVTTANAGANGVGHAVTVATAPLAQIDETYDVVVANILAPTLLELSADLGRVLAPGGTLIVSGILEHRYGHVLDALAPLQMTSCLTRAGWVAVSLAQP